MNMSHRILAATIASVALVASGAALARSGAASKMGAAAMMHHADVSALSARPVLGKNGKLLGIIYDTQKGAPGTSTVDLYTTSDIGLHGKVVQLPASMFAGQESEAPYMVLKAPTLTASKLRQMSAVPGTFWP